MSYTLDDVFKNSSCLGDRKRWRTTSLTVLEELKPLTSPQFTSPFPTTKHCFFRLTYMHIHRERGRVLARERQQISMRRRVSSRIIALWIGIKPWRTKVKLISIFFFFVSLFCFSLGHHLVASFGGDLEPEQVNDWQ